ncbi:MAG: RluA family pseudouridine synthase, partial [Chitinophagales bacterium]
QSIEIVFEDQDLLIVNKPPSIYTLPDRYNPQIPNLYGYLQRKYGEIFIVHRLDAETSGIICFAKNKEAHRKLSQDFEKRRVDKTYLAVIHGRLIQKEGTIDLKIKENPMRRGTMRANKSGKMAVTHYKIVEEFKNYSVVEVLLETGRMHQIRVHFQAIGHPLAVDEVYGEGDGFYLSSVKRRYHIDKFDEERPILKRLSLHAFRLTLNHPTSGEKVTFEAALPKDIEIMLKQLRKYNRVVM